MVKQLIISPDEVRQKETIALGTIPVNQYSRSLADELAAGTLTKDDAVRIYRDMCLIREFETMLDEIKRLGKYRDVAYVHQGPAHLSIGQEAAAVGEAFLLGVEDHIFGSHRSHGEILAKGLSAIHHLGEPDLQRIMEGYLGGDTLRVVEREPAAGIKDLAVNYLLYGLLAEIFARATGFNRGLGGSMHAFFPPFGIFPNNAIVGGSGDIAVGSALYKKTQRRPGITIANIGDASSACGPVWEGMQFATMGQYWTLWEPDYRGGLPIIFAFMNNFYGMGGPDARRDDGLPAPGDDRRGPEPVELPRRDRGREQPAGGPRRRAAQAGRDRRGRRARPARHPHLPPERPFAQRRRLLPDAGRARSSGRPWTPSRSSSDSSWRPRRPPRASWKPSRPASARQIRTACRLAADLTVSPRLTGDGDRAGHVLRTRPKRPPRRCPRRCRAEAAGRRTAACSRSPRSAGRASIPPPASG